MTAPACSSSSNPAVPAADAAPDVGVDAHLPVVADTGPCAGGDDPACFDPSSVVSFTVPPLPPAANQGLCASDDLLQQFLNACVYDFGADAASDPCVAYTQANPECARCLGGFSAPDAGSAAPSPWPALLQIDTAGDALPNVAACVAAISTGTETCKSNYTNNALCGLSGCATCSSTDEDACMNEQTTDYLCANSTCLEANPLDNACIAAILTVKVSEDQGELKCGWGDSIIAVKDFNAVFLKVGRTLCENAGADE
jgi:hypothetical protein